MRLKGQNLGLEAKSAKGLTVYSLKFGKFFAAAMCPILSGLDRVKIPKIGVFGDLP